MLSRCSQAVVIVEGKYDVILLEALLGENRRFVVVNGLKDMPVELWSCLYDKDECIIAVPSGGIRNVSEVAHKVVLVFRSFVETRGMCLVVLVDSDEMDPVDRVDAYYDEIWRRLPSHARDTSQSLQNRGHDFAYKCLDIHKAPLLCVASWRCTAECWIALADPRSPVTSLDPCKPHMRKQCHTIVRNMLNNATGNPATTLADQINHARGVWKNKFDSPRVHTKRPL